MREIRPSGSEGGARFKPLFLPLSPPSRPATGEKPEIGSQRSAVGIEPSEGDFPVHNGRCGSTGKL